MTSSDALLSWLCDLMPERAHGAALRSLAVQVAALSFERQRLASFVSEADARSLVAQLAAVGATAHVEQEPAARGKLLGLLGLGVFITMFAPLAGPALALLTYEGLGLVAIGLVVVVLAAIGLRTAQRARQVV